MAKRKVVPRPGAPAGHRLVRKPSRTNRSRIPIQIRQLKPRSVAREAVKRSRGWVRGFFSSKKSNQMIAWESQLEYRGCLVFEQTRVITAYRDQPTTITYTYKGRQRRYTPDFRLDFPDGSYVFVEIKPLSKLTGDELERLESIRQHLEGIGETFLVVTDEDLPKDHVAKSNLELLHLYRRHDVDEIEAEQVRRFISKEGVTHLKLASDNCKSIATVYALIASHTLAVDLKEPIGPNTPIFIFEEQSHAQPQFFCRTGVNFSERQIFDYSHRQR